MITAKLILLGSLTITSYRATPAQTRPGCKNNDTCWTAGNEHVSELGVAISPDLLDSGKVGYGDCIFIPGTGFRIVNDRMANRIHNGADVFVYSKEEEKAFKVRRVKVYKVIVQ